MPTWKQAWSAHRSSAVIAYGYFNPASGVANMTGSFAQSMVDAWTLIGTRAGGGDPYDYSGQTGLGAGVMGGPLNDATQNMANGASLIGDADEFVANPVPLWNASFSIASILDGGSVAAPSFVGAVGEVFGDYATSIKQWGEKAANALGGPLDKLSFIILGGLALVAYFELRKG